MLRGLEGRKCKTEMETGMKGRSKNKVRKKLEKMGEDEAERREHNGMAQQKGKRYAERYCIEKGWDCNKVTHLRKVKMG